MPLQIPLPIAWASRRARVGTLGRFARLCLSALLVLACASTALAQERQPRGGGQSEPQGSVLRLLPADAVSEHTIDTAAGKLVYTATAGTLSLYDQNGERSAAIFYTAYVAKSADGRPRPLTFVFNGGPGAASAYLHLGLVGPKILEYGREPGDLTSARLVENPDTWLAFTDLVLIDPVGSGWSRAAKPDGVNAFYGVRQDASTIAKVIALYVNHNGRVASPKYLLGESYGGFRAAKVARAVQEEQGIGISGILMVSPFLDGGLQLGGARLALGAALQLPSLAATELERTHGFSEAALAEAERFALGEYLTTLAGPEPTGEAAHVFYARVAKLTGFPEESVARARGFLRRDDYAKMLRAGEHKILSIYDATFAVPDPFPESPGREIEAVLDGFTRGYGGAFVAYARDELGFKTEMTYMLLNGEVSGKWDWDHGGRASANVNDDLRTQLAVDPAFRLLVANGRSDLVTPYGTSRYVLDHLPKSLAGDRAALKVYPGGHMFYVYPQSRRAFTADARALYQRAAPGE